MKTKDLSDTVLEGWNAESRLRYYAKRRGYYVMHTRGFELKRREKTGAGCYVLINMQTDTVALPAATLTDIFEFLQDHDHVQRRQNHDRQRHHIH
jgi:hypothetical protein